MDTYTINTTCSNCGHSEQVEIPKGEEVSVYLTIIKCPNCGCATLIKASGSVHSGLRQPSSKSDEDHLFLCDRGDYSGCKVGWKNNETLMGA